MASKGKRGRGGYGFKYTPPQEVVPVVPPPDPPPSGDGITTLNLITGAASGTYPFHTGMVFAKGAFADVATDLATAQVSIKRLWNDGSVKHAIISGRAALTQNVTRIVTLIDGTQPSGTALTSASIQAAAPTASVQFGSLGTVNLSDVLASPERTWISGPEMVESHYVSHLGVGRLNVRWRVRLFADGRMWVRAKVENGYIDGVNSDRVYEPTVTIGGVVKYARTAKAITGITPNAIDESGTPNPAFSLVQCANHGYVTGVSLNFSGVSGMTQINGLSAGIVPPITTNSFVIWLDTNAFSAYTSGGTASPVHMQNTAYTVDGWIGGDPQVTATHNVTYIRSTKLVPNYFKTPALESAMAAQPQTYVQGGNLNGQLPHAMAGAGFQHYIGIQPQWDGLYFISGDARALRSIDVTTRSHDHYGHTWRDSSSQRQFKPSDWPTIDFSTGSYRIARCSLSWEANHHPSIGYSSYMLTGDYDAYETLLNVSGAAYSVCGVAVGQGVNRHLLAEPRGIGWIIRTIGQLAAIAPDGDTVAADYRTLFANQFTYWKSIKDQAGMNQLGLLHGHTGISGFAVGDYNPWLYWFWESAVGYVSEIEPLTNMAELIDVRDYQYKHVVGYLGRSGISSEYDFRAAGISYAVCATGESTDPRDWFDSFGAVYQSTWGVPNDGTTLPPPYNNIPANYLDITPVTQAPNQGYWGLILAAMAYAVDHGAAGAAEAWSRMSGASNWSDLTGSSFDNMPMFGLMPRSLIPARVSVILPGQIANVSDNTLASVDPCPTNTCPYSPSGGQNGSFAWASGAYIDGVGSFGFLAHCGGGHNDYYGNEVYKFDLSSFLWSREKSPGLYGPKDDGVRGSQQWDHPAGSGNLVVNGKIYLYAEGTTTYQAAYQDEARTIPVSQPIQLDSIGVTPYAQIWGIDGLRYKIELRDSGNNILRTIDQSAMINPWGEYKTGEIAIPHTYRKMFGLSPTIGGGVGGSLVLSSLGPFGQGAFTAPAAHRFDFNAKTWNRYSNALAPSPMGIAPACLDKVHGKIYCLGMSQAQIQDYVLILDTTTKNWTQVNSVTHPGFPGSDVGILDYSPTLDVLVFVRIAGGSASETAPQVWTVSAATLRGGTGEAWVQRTTNSFPAGSSIITGASINWANWMSRFALYNGNGSARVVYLKPPGAVAGTWEWSKEDFTGASPATFGVSQDASYSRFQPIEAFKCFSWYTRGSAVQLWKPATT